MYAGRVRYDRGSCVGFCLKKNPEINGLTGAQSREVVVVGGEGDDGLLVFLYPHPRPSSVYSIGPVRM